MQSLTSLDTKRGSIKPTKHQIANYPQPKHARRQRQPSRKILNHIFALVEELLVEYE